MKPSPDRVLYLSRVIAKKLKDNLNLTQKADDAIEAKVRGSLAKRKNPNPRNEEFLFSRNLDDELRKHGA